MQFLSRKPYISVYEYPKELVVKQLNAWYRKKIGINRKKCQNWVETEFRAA